MFQPYVSPGGREVSECETETRVCVETIGGAFGFTGKNPAGSQDGNQTPQRPAEP